MRLLGALVCVLGLLAASGAADRPHVYLVIVDGLDARLVTPGHMPHLFEALKSEPARSSIFPAARAVMPARTNPNHVSLLTGVYPEAHGITGNAYWRRSPGATAERLDAAARVEVETLFTTAEDMAPEMITVGVFSKCKLARLFSDAPGRQHAPDRLWSGEEGTPAACGQGSQPAGDAETMTAALGLIERPEPDLAVVALAGVDRTAHAHGPDGPACEQAVTAADAAIGLLVERLHGLGRWGRSVLIVTGDHGFAAVGPTAERPYPLITFGRDLLRARVSGVHVVDDGGIEHVYADAVGADAAEPGAAAATLVRVADVARETPGIAEILARLPVAGVTPMTSAHPDWHLAHERVGELVLVAGPGYHFVDPFDPEEAAFLGNHGGPDTLVVPLVVTGGAPQLTAAPAGTPPPSIVDVAPTIARLLGLRASHRIDGAAVPPELAGKPLAAVLAEPLPR